MWSSDSGQQGPGPDSKCILGLVRPFFSIPSQLQAQPHPCPSPCPCPSHPILSSSRFIHAFVTNVETGGLLARTGELSCAGRGGWRMDVVSVVRVWGHLADTARGLHGWTKDPAECKPQTLSPQQTCHCAAVQFERSFRCGGGAAGWFRLVLGGPIASLELPP